MLPACFLPEPFLLPYFLSFFVGFYFHRRLQVTVRSIVDLKLADADIPKLKIIKLMRKALTFMSAKQCSVLKTESSDDHYKKEQQHWINDLLSGGSLANFRAKTKSTIETLKLRSCMFAFWTRHWCGVNFPLFFLESSFFLTYPSTNITRDVLYP